MMKQGILSALLVLIFTIGSKAQCQCEVYTYESKIKYFDLETQKKEEKVFSKIQEKRALSVNSNMPYQQIFYVCKNQLYGEQKYAFLEEPYIHFIQKDEEVYSVNCETGKKKTAKNYPLEITPDQFKKSNKKCEEYNGKRYQCYTAKSNNNTVWIWVDTQVKDLPENNFFNQFVFKKQLIVKKELYYNYRNVSRITLLKSLGERKINWNEKLQLIQGICDDDKMYASIEQNKKFETKPIKVGDVLPTYSYRDVDFEIQELNQFKGNGKYTLLEFWGTWCGPCLKAVPKLEALQKEFKDRLEILSFNCKDYKSSYVKKMIAHKKLSWKQAYVTPKLLKSLNVTGRFPTVVLLDDQMKVVLIGNPHLDFDRLKENLKNKDF